MAGKKRPPPTVVEPDAAASDSSLDEAAAKPALAAEAPAKKKKLAMERRKQRKELDKDRHRQSAKSDAIATRQTQPQVPPAVAAEAAVAVPPLLAPMAARSGLHMNVFRDLASPEASVRDAAAEALVAELWDLQRAYEKGAWNGKREVGYCDGSSQMEAEKDDGLENCAPSVRHAIRWLIRGISSSREFARQGFALGLVVVLESIQAISVGAVMKLEAKDNLLGCLFGFGSLARSGRVSGQ